MKIITVYTIVYNNEIKYVLNANLHHTRGETKLQQNSTEISHYWLDDDSVEVYIDGRAEYYDAVFFEDLDKSNEFFIYVSTDQYYTHSLFDITNTSVYDTGMVRLLKIDPTLYNKETIYGLLDFTRKL
ncbi:hypothetical protein FOI42_RS03735 [Escherichia coli]|nr:hypothetical protein [Escherichia coli]HCQ0858568.1 hypothetical protein [Escherichia coli]